MDSGIEPTTRVIIVQSIQSGVFGKLARGQTLSFSVVQPNTILGITILWPLYITINNNCNISLIIPEQFTVKAYTQLYLKERGRRGEPKNDALLFQSIQSVDIHFQNAHKTLFQFYECAVTTVTGIKLLVKIAWTGSEDSI